MRVPLHKQLDGQVVQIIDRMVKQMFWSHIQSDDVSSRSASIEIELETNGLEAAPKVIIFCHRPDPLSEQLDYVGWREAVFGRQIYDLMRFLDERGQVATGITLRCRAARSPSSVDYHMDLHDVVSA